MPAKLSAEEDSFLPNLRQIDFFRSLVDLFRIPI